MIKNNIKICTKLLFEELRNNNWYDLYELHKKYHISPTEVIISSNILLEKNIIKIRKDNFVKLCPNLNNTQISFINFIYKTHTPDILKEISLDTDSLHE